MVWGQAIHVMLLTHAKWRTFTSRPIPPATSSEVMLALSCDSREAVDGMNKVAADNGGTADVNQPEPSQTWMVQGGGEREGAAVPQCWIAEGATMMRRRSFCWNREPSEQEIERVGQTGCVAGA